MTEHTTGSRKDYQVKFPRMSLYLRFSSICAFLISITFLLIQYVGSPPTENGPMSIVCSIAIIVLSGTLMFVEILILGSSLSLSLWRSAAIAWVASNVDENISPTDVTMLRKATVVPYRNVQIGIPLLSFSLVVVVLSFPIGKMIATTLNVDLVDALLVMTAICIGFNLIIEYSHIRLERKYSLMPESELHSALALATPAESISGISEVLASKNSVNTPRWFLIMNILLFSIWCVVSVLLLIV